VPARALLARCFRSGPTRLRFSATFPSMSGEQSNEDRFPGLPRTLFELCSRVIKQELLAPGSYMALTCIRHGPAGKLPWACWGWPSGGHLGGPVRAWGNRAVMRGVKRAVGLCTLWLLASGASELAADRLAYERPQRETGSATSAIGWAGPVKPTAPAVSKPEPEPGPSWGQHTKRPGP